MLFKTEHFGHNSYGYNRTHSRSWLTPILFLNFEFMIFTNHIQNLQLDTFAIIVLVDRTKEQINKTDFP